MITLYLFLPLKTHEIQEITAAKPNLIPLSNCHFTEDAVTKALDKIKVNKNPGSDYIALRVLKEETLKSANLLQYYLMNL